MTKTRKHVSHVAFTMAEILLSLTIIGVVAAITLPSLTGNINERTWNTQRKALYARFSQAIALMPALNGFGTLTEAVGTEGEEGYVAPVDTAAETFVTAGLSKVLKINNVCDSDSLGDCGIPEKITTAMADGTLNREAIKTLATYNSMFAESFSYAGSVYPYFSFGKKSTKAVAFETTNGESVLAYYNPNCQSDMQLDFAYVQEKLCANFIFDLNGSKGPNTFGKDIGFVSVFYPSDPVVVSPNPVVRVSAITSQGVAQKDAAKVCSANFENSRVPNREELMAMSVNASIFNLAENTASFVSSSIVTKDSSKAWFVSLNTGRVHHYDRDEVSAALWCINR